MKRERDFAVWQKSKKYNKVTSALPSKPSFEQITKKKHKKKKVPEDTSILKENGSRNKEKSFVKRFMKFIKN